jgi:hypothetical protein
MHMHDTCQIEAVLLPEVEYLQGLGPAFSRQLRSAKEKLSSLCNSAADHCEAFLGLVEAV